MSSDKDTTNNLIINYDLQLLTNRLYRNVICLGPMVRINSLPLRLLCLEYGVHTIFTEEIIDKRLVKCNRIDHNSDNNNSIDYIIDKTILLSTIPSIEKQHIILQLGIFLIV